MSANIDIARMLRDAAALIYVDDGEEIGPAMAHVAEGLRKFSSAVDRMADIYYRYSEERTSAPATAGWQPIETAPKDGTQVLLCQATDAGGNPIEPLGIFCQVAAWWQEEEDPNEPGEWIVYCSIPAEPKLFFDPTHWMPLPPNPLAR